MSLPLRIQSKSEALAVLEELGRRQKVKASLVDEDFPKQAAFIRDRSRQKAAICTRRAGKSQAIGRMLVNDGLEIPAAQLYIGLTRDSAKRVMWNEVLPELDEKYKLGATFNESSLTMTLPNGAPIYLLGGDASPREMKKYLGMKLLNAAIDEAQSFRVQMRTMVYEILKPALADLRGVITLGGTPDDLCDGLFYDITRQDGVNREPGWSVHEWTAYDNPYMAAQWEEEIEGLKRDNPRIVETPLFQRMYMGRWVTDTSKLCYKYDPKRNYVEALPAGQYMNVLGVDLGFEDASAFATVSYSEDDPNVYIRLPYKKSGMIISDVAERLRYYQQVASPFSWQVDGAAKQAVEELKQRFGFPLEAAEKSGKAEFIEIFNSELIAGRIKLVGPESKPIAEEWGSLIWDDRSGKRQEHPACPNHLSDAVLYAWRKCYHYLHKPKTKTARTAADEVDAWERRELERLSEKKFVPFWMRDE